MAILLTKTSSSCFRGFVANGVPSLPGRRDVKFVRYPLRRINGDGGRS
jgi:hypothetical protein